MHAHDSITMQAMAACWAIEQAIVYRTVVCMWYTSNRACPHKKRGQGVMQHLITLHDT